jgi:predicted transcriptional regulator of viral defense system
MRLTTAHSRLLSLAAPVITTADAAALLGLERGHASKLLARLSETGHVVRLCRGLWAFPGRIRPMALAEYLTAPFPSYVSLYSALYYHGMISQIPAVLYASSLHRTRKFHTAFGTVSVHHLAPSFFFGFEAAAGNEARLATPEKAILDVLYLTPSRTRLFRSLPELELPKSFSRARARRMLLRIPSARRRKMVSMRLEHLLRRL